MTNLQDYRTRVDLTQTELAEWSQVSVQTIRALEQGSKDPRDVKISTAVKIVSALYVFIKKDQDLMKFLEFGMDTKENKLHMLQDIFDAF